MYTLDDELVVGEDSRAVFESEVGIHRNSTNSIMVDIQLINTFFV